MKTGLTVAPFDAGRHSSLGGGGGPGGAVTYGSGGQPSMGGAIAYKDAGALGGQGGSSTGTYTSTKPPLGTGGSKADARDGNADNRTNAGGSGGSTKRDALALADRLISPDAAPGTPTIDPDTGYITIPTGTVVMSGYLSYSGGGLGTDVNPPTLPTPTSFCAKGTVGASSTYHSWGNVGFTVNQAQSGSSGSTSSLPLVGSSITVSYSNKGGSILELQLWDGSNYWCSRLPPSAGPNTVTIPFSSLNTACWDMSGKDFVSGTPINMVQFLIPCSATTPTPFDFCFLGLTVN